jgi:hypothetical protein
MVMSYLTLTLKNSSSILFNVENYCFEMDAWYSFSLMKLTSQHQISSSRMRSSNCIPHPTLLYPIQLPSDLLNTKLNPLSRMSLQVPLQYPPPSEKMYFCFLQEHHRWRSISLGYLQYSSMWHTIVLQWMIGIHSHS